MGNTVIDGASDPILPNFNAADRYTERMTYDKNSNITSVERYGMNNQRQYGLIDSLVISRNGNQLKTIEDYAEKHLTYTGASDFYDGMTSNNEYSYNANGALVKDLNRKIGYIGYDNLGNIRNISFHTANANSIEYIYAADGTKLRSIHRPASSSALTNSIDYIGNLILKNGQPSMYPFDGGYATFNSNGAINGWHYYIQDYMGNNRMVVNKNGTKEQITHYYPYGAVIGDISTNESVQKYKFEGKELDRTFGLDNYDIHARQYFAMAPMWDRIDPLAEKYYGISPYSYCGGDPVNKGDYEGKDVCILSAPFDAKEFGHMAILIQNKDKKWALYSKNGTSLVICGFNSWDKPGDDKGNKVWDSPEAFLADYSNNVDKEGNIEYTNGYTISCNETDDAAAASAVLEEINEYYSVIGNNCAVAVQKALDAISSKHVDNGSKGSNGDKTIIPKQIYKNIKENNEGIETILLLPIEIMYSNEEE